LGGIGTDDKQCYNEKLENFGDQHIFKGKLEK
jgi:hypothetical protein